ncbi:MAG TPA: sigma-70 family RNA polymerase sigma factor [Candidatus Limnocylindrales bacterium]|nr:sigma-70 family RNA polymerase sigma factor [Candidatus Limnocylindrales bacterium]
MTDQDWLATRFEAERPRLRAVAYRMLGSTAEAEDAVQDAWLRLSRTDASAIDNVGAWLTTVVARLALDRLRSARARHEQTSEGHLPDPIVETADAVEPAGGPDPAEQAELADSIGLAMLVVLEQLSPAERLAFVLHDTFGLPFDEIAPIVDRSTEATRQLASRARRRVRGESPSVRVSRRRQQELIDAFLAAARGGDFDALVRILDPEVVVRADFGTLGAFGSGNVPTVFHGPADAARGALAFRHLAGGARRATVSGAPGFVVFNQGKPYAVLAFAFAGDRIIEIDVLGDPERLARLDLTAVGIG